MNIEKYTERSRVRAVGAIAGDARGAPAVHPGSARLRRGAGAGLIEAR